MCIWSHGGFSVDQSVFLPAGDRTGIERLVHYLTRCPFSLSEPVKVPQSGLDVREKVASKDAAFPPPCSTRLPGLNSFRSRQIELPITPPPFDGIGTQAVLPVLFAENWYEQGNWPLVAAILVFAVMQALTYWQMLLRSRESLAVQLTMRRIDLISEQLAQFYNPLYALLTANGHVVEHLGPETFPEDEISADAAAANWQAMKEEVILPNNRQVAEILRSKTHLMSASDDMSHYLQLNNHLAFYEVFTKRRTEAIERFRFPAEVVSHIARKRSELASELNDLKAMKKR